jgi:hypothetical protein
VLSKKILDAFVDLFRSPSIRIRNRFHAVAAMDSIFDDVVMTTVEDGGAS